VKNVRATVAVMLLPILSAGCSEAGADNAACDRSCLVGVTDSYLAALESRDPSAAPLARNVTFVENRERLDPGEGLWAEAGASTSDSGIYVPDPELQQIGWIGMVERNGKPMLLALRLKFEDRRITEAEHLLAEPVDGAMTTPRQGLLATIPEDKRLSHAELLRIGASYYDALDDNDASLAAFSDDCQLVENGAITAGPGQVRRSNAALVDARVAGDCAAQIGSQAFVYIDRIEARRMVAADRVTGLVFGLSQFRHPMDNLPYKVILADGSTIERNRQNMPFAPFDITAAHIFKIGPDGQIQEIEAVGASAPYGAPVGWE
jgi:hypothetical protein